MCLIICTPKHCHIIRRNRQFHGQLESRHEIRYHRCKPRADACQDSRGIPGYPRVIQEQYQSPQNFGGTGIQGTCLQHAESGEFEIFGRG